MKITAFAFFAALAIPSFAGESAIAAQPGGDFTSAPAMQFRVIRSGPAAGSHPGRSSAVKVLYDVRAPDGSLVDNHGGQPAIIPLRALTAGFQQALMMMRPGDVWEISVPKELAYGDYGSPLSGTRLTARLELIEAADLPPIPPPFLTEMPSK